MGPWAGVSMVRRSWLLVILLAVLAMVASLVVSPAAAAPPATSGKPEALAPAAAQAVEPLAQASPPYTPVPPVRIADTRVRQPVAFPASKVPVPAGGTLEVPVGGLNGVPGDAAAVVANITATAPDGAGHLRVFPCGQARPGASTLNSPTGASVANGTIVGLGAGGKICVYTPTRTHVLVDVVGYFPAGAAYTALAPVRIADTRVGQPVAFPASKVPVPAGGTLEVPVGGANGVPADAAAVVANITATAPDGAGHLRVFPCGQARPGASTLNYPAGASVANGTIVGLGTGGKICVYTPTRTHVLVDVVGYFPAGAAYTALAPVRIADTRVGQPVAFPASKVPVPAGGTLEVPVGGLNGVPGDAAAVVANITATAPDGAGHLRVFPCGQARPGASTLNYPTGASVANGTIVGLGAGGKICVYTPTRTHVLVDVVGYFPAEVVAVRVAADSAADVPLSTVAQVETATATKAVAGLTWAVREGRLVAIGAKSAAVGTHRVPVRGTGCLAGRCGVPYLVNVDVRISPVAVPDNEQVAAFTDPSPARVSASEPLIPGVTALRDEVHLVVGTPEAPGTRAAAQSAAAAVGAVISGGWQDLGVFELRWTTPPTDLQAVIDQLNALPGIQASRSTLSDLGEASVSAALPAKLPPGDWDDDGPSRRWHLEQIRAPRPGTPLLTAT